MSEEFFSKNSSLELKNEVYSPDIGKKIFDFLFKTKFLEIRKSDEDFENWIQTMSYDEFSLYLTRLNGMMRELPKNKRAIDGKNVEIVSGIAQDSISYLPPHSEDKERLMEDAFNSFKKIKNNNDRALLLYYVLQAIHPYVDGNGRTGRLLYTLLSDDFKIEESSYFSSLLNHDEENNDVGEGRKLFGEKIIQPENAYYLINREIAKKIFGESFISEFGKIYYSEISGVSSPLSEKIDITFSEKRYVEKILSEGDVPCFPFRSLVILQFLQEEKIEGCIFEVARKVSPKEGGSLQVKEDIGKKIFAIDSEKFLEKLNEVSVRRLIQIHKDIKALFVQEMIDIFENPQNHSINEEGLFIPIKDKFKKS